MAPFVPSQISASPCIMLSYMFSLSLSLVSFSSLTFPLPFIPDYLSPSLSIPHSLLSFSIPHSVPHTSLLLSLSRPGPLTPDYSDKPTAMGKHSIETLSSVLCFLFLPECLLSSPLSPCAPHDRSYYYCHCHENGYTNNTYLVGVTYCLQTLLTNQGGAWGDI